MLLVIESGKEPCVSHQTMRKQSSSRLQHDREGAGSRTDHSNSVARWRDPWAKASPCHHTFHIPILRRNHTAQSQPESFCLSGYSFSTSVKPHHSLIFRFGAGMPREESSFLLLPSGKAHVGLSDQRCCVAPFGVAS